MGEVLLEIESLTKHYGSAGAFHSSARHVVQAVNGVSFTIEEGTTFALVGESGSGKTSITRVILRLEGPTSGTVRYRNNVVHDLKGPALRQYKRAVQAVFQDPYGSMNPKMRVIDVIAEPLRIHERMSGRALRDRVAELLGHVGLSPASADLYPHQFSGGQRQRIAIARALALRPKLIILDEPVSGLDVSIRAQILNLLRDLQKSDGLTYLLVSHDLAIVRHMSHKVGVMYAGKLVELAPTEQFYREPLHPYSKALLVAVPQPDPDVPMAARLEGEVASPINPPSGCRFHPRCPIYQGTAACRDIDPAFREVRVGHRAACHKLEAELATTAMPVHAQSSRSDAGAHHAPS